MFSDTQKADFLKQLQAFRHAFVDEGVAFIEAKRKDDGRAVLLACVVTTVELPPLIMGGDPQRFEKTVPIFEFVDPHGTNPYVSPDPELIETPSSGVIVDAHVLSRTVEPADA